MKKDAAVLILIIIITKFFGFLREILISCYYGASYISDAYLVALTIPGTLFSVIGAGIITGYIPMYSRIEKEQNTKTSDRFTASFINVILIACAFLIGIVLIFTNPIVKVFASGFTGEVLKLASEFTRITVIGILFTGVVYVLTGYLNVKKQFLAPALVSLPFNLCIITSIILSHYTSVRYLPIGSALAEAAELLFLIPIAYRYGFRYHFHIDNKDGYLKQILTLSLPVMLGISINQVNTLVDKTIASRITAGGISALNYASRLTGIIQGIYISSITTVLFPFLSKTAAQKDMETLKKYISKALIGISLLVIPATIGFMFLAEPVVIFLYGRGAFDQEAIRLTSSALFFYAIGMLGYGLREIISRVFYAVQDTKTPMINAAAGMMVNIILNLLLSRFMGIGGLAFATSLVGSGTSLMLLVSLKKKICDFDLRRFGIAFLKILSASLIMGLVVKLSFPVLTKTFHQSVALVMVVIIGVLVYGIVIWSVRIEEAVSMVHTALRKLGIRKEAVAPDWEQLLESTNYQRMREPVRRKRRIRVGIVLVTYNNLNGLTAVLERLYSQTFRDYDLYIVNNGSSDNTGEYLTRIGTRSRNIYYFNLKSCMGSAGGFYYGFKAAYENGADFIWGLDDCSLPMKNALAELVALYPAKEKACYVSQMIDEYHRKLIHERKKVKSRIIMPYFPFAGLFIPRKLIDDVGLPRAELYQLFDDIEYSNRAKRAGYQIICAQTSLLQYQGGLTDVKTVKIMGNAMLIPEMSEESWYYYMRNGILVLSDKDIQYRQYRKKHFRMLIGVLKIYPGSFSSALRGYLDGMRGYTGKRRLHKGS